VTPRAHRGILCRLLIGLAAVVSTSASLTSVHPAVGQSSTPIRGFTESLDMIRNLLDRGRGIEAENVARALLVRVESSRGPDAVEVAEVLDLLGRAVRRSSKVTNQEKRAIAERALVIKEKVFGPLHPEVATSLINLGVQRALAGELAAARPLLERAVTIREAAFGPNHLAVAAALQSLAGLLITVRDDGTAKALLERSQRIRESILGEGNLQTVRTLVNLGIFYQETGDYAAARERFVRARMLAQRFAGPADPFTLHVLTGVAVVLSELGGDFAGSARLNEQLVLFTERAYGPNDQRLRTPLENLAMDLRDLGDYAAAEPAARRSLAIAERTFGPKHPEVAQSLHTLATVFAGLGRYAEAMASFERATQINEEVLQPADPKRGRAAWFISDLFALSGYGPDDVDLFERVLAARERSGGLGNPRTAESLRNLAAVLSSPDDYRRARPLFERALGSQEMFLGPDHPEVGAAATNLADVLSRSGEDQLARRHYERALNIWESSLGVKHPKVATGLVNLARFHLKTGSDENAAPLLARALAIQQEALGPEHPDVVLTLRSQAELAARAGARAEAFSLAARADEIAREHLRLTVRTLPERQALAYASSFGADLDLMLSLASSESSGRGFLTQAWDAVIRDRGIVLDEMAARHRLARTGDTPDTVRLAEALGAARERLAALAVRGIRNDPPERYRRLLDEATAAKEGAERALAEHSVRFRDDQSRARIHLAEISAALESDSALVGFVRYRAPRPAAGEGSTPGRETEPAYLAFIVSAADRRPALVPLGSAADIDRLVVQWRKQIDQEAITAGRGAARSEAAYRRVATDLRRQIWDPLARHLSTSTRVFVVPDGALHLVSFAALPTGASQYLVESGPVIHYLSTERDLVLTHSREVDGRGLLALGDPAFDGLMQSSAGASPSYRGPRPTCLDFESMRFEPLPASLTEVEDVTTVWTKSYAATSEGSSAAAVRLTGSGASESAFKTQAVGRRVLHLATHGFFLGGQCAPVGGPEQASGTGTSSRIARENPLLMSGLVLAGANQRSLAPDQPDQEDGVLTAEEVATLDLDGVEWAVLSGCDTGQGEHRTGEGVFGLQRAFQMAGARTVIMSLWPVEDHATRQWMTALYTGRFLKGLGTSAAVRGAGLTVLRARRAKGLGGHPFYWGAFVGSGDWR